jgi:hypothetical protein
MCPGPNIGMVRPRTFSLVLVGMAREPGGKSLPAFSFWDAPFMRYYDTA